MQKINIDFLHIAVRSKYHRDEVIIRVLIGLTHRNVKIHLDFH